MNTFGVRRAKVRLGAAVLVAAILVLLAEQSASAAGQPTWVADTPPTSTAVGEAYSYRYLAESPSGDPPPRYAFVGSLPPGLALDGTTGMLAGSPSTAGDFTFRIQAINDASYINSPRTTITVAPAQQQITFTSTPPVPATIGGTYQVTATGGGSGNPVLFSVNANSTEGACEVTLTGLVTFTGSGHCIINAFQAGDANHDPGRASQTITVTAAPTPTPTSSPPPTSRPHTRARSASEPRHPAARSELAVTGTNTFRSLALAIVLVVVGVGLVMVAGRRQGIH
jgi:hypothetical protein